MITLEEVLQNESGFHIRPAQLFVEKASEFSSGVVVGNEEGMETDGKSILGLMTMGFVCGSKVVIKIEGADEDAAAQALAELVRSKFGEK
ncbi:HPr family phosphocarrier protein [uncultured Anaeromusa sp.]|uniref:HPr family phosphocarrier protein n=1 Tax=uncultured Anaeromusa sp. TaxID=673273 RepID=UPI0029C6764E|nr:HPr family phosphocarrier protein [uncultured Anaeromusa sp.]